MAALAHPRPESTWVMEGRAGGNFISLSEVNTGRFLDPPEFTVIHAKGNEENLFDRVDYQLSSSDSVHLNLGFSRSWFQNPNSFDNVLHLGENDPSGHPLGPTDQHAQIKTFNIRPSWTKLLSNSAVFSLGAFVRTSTTTTHRQPLRRSIAIQQETVARHRTLMNAAVRSDFSYVKGMHNVKIGHLPAHI